MELQEVKNLIRMGFEDPRFFKRSTWTKIERIMQYLTNKGCIKENVGNTKFKTLYGGSPLESDVQNWAVMYMRSPFVEHLNELKKISKDLGLPLNDGRVLKEFMNTKY